MSEQFYTQAFLFVGGLAGGYVTARTVFKIGLAALSLASTIAYLISITDKESAALSLLYTALIKYASLLVNGITRHGGLAILLGYFLGALFTFYRWRIETDRRKGIVQLPFYPRYGGDQDVHLKRT